MIFYSQFNICRCLRVKANIFIRNFLNNTFIFNHKTLNLYENLTMLFNETFENFI